MLAGEFGGHSAFPGFYWRVNECGQFRQLLLIGKNECRKTPPVDGAKEFTYGLVSFPAWLDHLMAQLIGLYQKTAQIGQSSTHEALAGCQAAGEADVKHY